MRHLVLLLLLPTLSYADELCITEESGIVTIESGNRAGTLKGAKCKPANKKPKAKATKRKKRAPKAKRKIYKSPTAPSGAKFGSSHDKNRIFTHANGVLSGPVHALFSLLISLDERATGEETDPLSVIHYGDSHTQVGTFSNAMRKALSEPPISPGFVTQNFPNYWNAKVTRSKGWRRQNWMRNDIPPFGPLGIAFGTNKADETMTLTITDKHRPADGISVTLIYDGPADHRPFEVNIPRRNPTLITPRSPSSRFKAKGAPTYKELKLELPANVKQVTVKTVGEDDERSVRIFGFLVQYQDALLEWNSLGVGGTIINNMLRSKDGAVETFLRNRKPDLVVGWYGTNSLASKTLSIKRYAKAYRKFLTKLAHSAPKATCLMIGPLDFSKRPSKCFLSTKQLEAKRWRRSKLRWRTLYGNWRTRSCTPDKLINHSKQGRYRFPVPNIQNMSDWNEHKKACEYRTVPLIEEMIESQRAIAHEKGCLYFDTYKFMGGSGGIHKWACKESPPLAALDHVHLTTAGYRKLGKAIIDEVKSAIMTQIYEE